MLDQGQTNVPAPSQIEPALQAISNRLNNVREYLSATAENLRSTADDTFGPSPTAEKTAEIKPVPAGLVGRINEQIDAILMVADGLSATAERLRRLA